MEFSAAALKLQVRPQTVVDLEKYFITVEKELLPAVIQTIALQEYETQKEAGNKASNILVDGKSVKERDIDETKRRVQIFFVDVDVLVRAAEFAYSLLWQLYGGGKSARSMQLWVYAGSAAAQLHSPAELRPWLEAHAADGPNVRISGPDTPYRRRKYYQPPGTPRVKKGRSSRVRRDRSGRAIGVDEKSKNLVEYITTGTVADIVKRSFAGNYGKTLYINQKWVKVRVPSWRGARDAEQGIPSLLLGLRGRGAL